MRLSSILSDGVRTVEQVESFIDKEKYTSDKEDESSELQYISSGDIIDLRVGRINLPFHSTRCNDTTMYASPHKLHCLIISNNLISVDCELACTEFDQENPICRECNAAVQKWFLLEVDDVFLPMPTVKIIKQNHRLPDHILLPIETQDKFSEWFAKADIAYKERLGAGSVIYLRSIFEKITEEVANELGEDVVQSIYNRGKRKPFDQVLRVVNEHCSIIPRQYAENGYDLFRRLSTIAHGNSDESTALQQYPALKRLVKSIVDNVEHNKNEITRNQEVRAALEALNICPEGSEPND